MPPSQRTGPDTRGARRATLVQMAAYLITIPISIPANILLARYLGPAQFGDYTWAMLVLSFFALFSTMGTEQIIVRDLSTSERSAWPAVMTTAIGLRLVTSTVALALCWGVTLLLPISANQRLLVLAASGTLLFSFQFSSSLKTTFDLGFRSEQHMLTPAALLAIDRVVTALLIGVGVWLKLPLFWLALFIVYSDVPFFVLLALASWRAHGWRIRLPHWREFAQLRISLPLMLDNTLSFIHHRADIFLLAAISGPFSVGIYAAAQRVLDPLGSAINMFCTSFYPALASAREQSPTSFARTLTTGLSYVLLALAPLAVVLTLRDREVVALLYGAKYAGSALPLALLMWALVAVAVMEVVYSACLAARMERFVPWVSGLAMVGNLSLNALLLPHWGATGAAWSTLGSESLQGLVLGVALARRERTLPYLRPLARIVICQVLLAAILLVGQRVPLLMLLPLATVGYLLAANATGALPLRPALVQTHATLIELRQRLARTGHGGAWASGPALNGLATLAASGAWGVGVLDALPSRLFAVSWQARFHRWLVAAQGSWPSLGHAFTSTTTQVAPAYAYASGNASVPGRLTTFELALVHAAAGPRGRLPRWPGLPGWATTLALGALCLSSSVAISLNPKLAGAALIALVLLALTWQFPMEALIGMALVLPFYDFMLQVLRLKLGLSGTELLAAQSLKEVVLVVAIVATLLRNVRTRTASGRWSLSGVLVLGIVALTIAWMPLAYSTTIALYGARSMLEPFVFWLAVYLARPDARRIQQMVSGLIVVATISSLFAIFQHFFWKSFYLAYDYNGATTWAGGNFYAVGLNVDRSSAFMALPQEFGAYLMLAIALTVSWLVATRRARLFVPLIIMVGGLLVTFQRSSWIGTVVALLVFLWLAIQTRRWRHPLLVVGLVGAVLAVVAVIVVARIDVAQMLSATLTLNDPSAHAHYTELFNDGPRLIGANPFGLGTGMSGVRTESFTANLGQFYNETFYWTVAAQWGIPGLLLVVAFLVALVARARRLALDPRAGELTRRLGAAVAATTTGMLVASVTFNQWQLPTFAYTFGLVCGLLSASAAHRGASQTQIGRS
jgi:O-antigen/teichoic acid export membrane protein